LLSIQHLLRQSSRGAGICAGGCGGAGLRRGRAKHVKGVFYLRVGKTHLLLLNPVRFGKQPKLAQFLSNARPTAWVIEDVILR
jgi:hypothetical protein